ncbi:hypothetical protein HMPREF1566_3808 [Providencia alcalifaciens PAL-1]|nr:hypothetical protein HMPREF1566_3808 [Providencia alcalifaciens PAL-1]
MNVPAAGGHGGNTANVSTVIETKNGDSNSALNAAASKLATALDVNTNQNSDLIGAAKQTMRATEEVLGNLTGSSVQSSSVLRVATLRFTNNINIESSRHHDVVDATRKVLEKTQELLSKSTLSSDKSK